MIRQHQRQQKEDGNAQWLSSSSNVDLPNIYKIAGCTDFIRLVIESVVIDLQGGLITNVNTPWLIEPLRLAAVRVDFEFLNLIMDNIAMDAQLVWSEIYHKHSLDEVKKWMHSKINLDDVAFQQDKIRLA
jgi:hypothetical protein